MTEGVMTRDELLVVGCEEVSLRGERKVYVKNGEFIASECPKCHKVRSASFFNRDKNKAYGISPKCKICVKQYEKENRDSIARRNSDRYQDKKEEIKAARKLYYIENRDAVLKQNKRWNAKNRERMREWGAIYRSENRERERAWRKKYKLENPTKHKLYAHRRFARKRALPYDETHEQRAIVWAAFGSACALTGESGDLHTDHTIPLAVGHGGTTYGNMIPLSDELNASKNDRHLFEWFDANRERFNLEQSRFDALIAYLAGANEMTTAEYRAYVDWCFDNPRVIDDATGELVFRDGPINERNTYESRR